MAPYTHSQLVAFAIIPKFSALLSGCGSFYVIQDVLRSPAKLKLAYCRLLLSFNSYLMSGSIATFFTTWAIPSDELALYASGTTATRTAQGFFTQLGVGALINSLGLTFYYYLLFVCQWPDWKIKKVEMLVHVSAFTWGFGTSILALSLKLYNNANLWCWISSLPQSCEGGNIPGDKGQGACERGQNAWLYRWLLFYAPNVLALLLTTLIMIRVTCFVRSTNKKTQKYRYKGTEGSNRKGKNQSMSLYNQVFWQSVHYVSVFYMCLVFPILGRTLEMLTDTTPAWTLIGFCIFGPLQGFMNFTVYIRPRLTDKPFLTRLRTGPSILVASFSSMVKRSTVILRRRSTVFREQPAKNDPASSTAIEGDDRQVAVAEEDASVAEDQSEPLTDKMKDISTYDPSYVLMNMSAFHRQDPNTEDERPSISSRIPSQRLSDGSRLSWIPHLRLMSISRRASEPLEVAMEEEDNDDDGSFFCEAVNSSDPDVPSNLQETGSRLSWIPARRLMSISRRASEPLEVAMEEEDNDDDGSFFCKAVKSGDPDVPSNLQETVDA